MQEAGRTPLTLIHAKHLPSRDSFEDVELFAANNHVVRGQDDMSTGVSCAVRIAVLGPTYALSPSGRPTLPL